MERDIIRWTLLCYLVCLVVAVLIIIKICPVVWGTIVIITTIASAVYKIYKIQE